MTIQRFHTNQRMSQMVIHNDTIYLAGQVGSPENSVADQTRDCLDKVDAPVSYTHLTLPTNREV